MKNPIHNAVVQISKREVVACKRCGCPDLAWVTYKSGKHALVKVSYQRPLWRGEGRAPEGIFALKFDYHRCDEYLAAKLDAERRASACHPKADNPLVILADAMGHLFAVAARLGLVVDLSNPNSDMGAALQILMVAQREIPNPNPEVR